MANDDLVLYDVKSGVAVLTFNRPERLNAWTGALGEQYFARLDDAVADPGVKVIVVTGAGRGFCAGADMDVLQGIERGGGTTSAEAPKPVWYATTLPKPVIAAVNGACAGLGMVHALMCDMRFAAAGAKFTTAFARRGLIAEYGLSWVAPRLVGPARAMDIILSGRTFLAEEAAAMGLVNEVVPGEQLMDHVMAYATELGTWSSPASMAAMKSQIWADLGVTLPEATERAIDLMKLSLTRSDFKEGVSSYLEKRTPNFAPLAK
jgi:enoyl-CoA hydratase/carnithine racemase